MSAVEDAKELEASWQGQVDDGFKKFLGEPLVKVITSQIPEGPTEGVLKELLRAAWNQGAQQGKVSALVTLVTSMLPKGPR